MFQRVALYPRKTLTVFTAAALTTVDSNSHASASLTRRVNQKENHKAAFLLPTHVTQQLYSAFFTAAIKQWGKQVIP